MYKSLLVAAITLPLATISARAAELAPMVGLEKNFRTGASALIYYTEGVDGDHVVTTVQSDDTESMKIFRFISILAPGQTAEISVPHELGQTPDTIVIRRVGNRLLVEDDVEIASTEQQAQKSTVASPR
jgi:hypothetical protein